MDTRNFACLKHHGIMFNAWARMPETRLRSTCLDATTAGFHRHRIPLFKGRPYEATVARFSPYGHTWDANESARKAPSVI